jgi:uncharacterized protein YndB with AHSA1/START domain
MTRQKSFKRHVRERMAKTGERYAAARSQLAARRDGARGVRMNLAAAVEIASDRKLTEATGRGWESWLTILDEWDARDKKHGETVGFLMAEHGVPGWWAQAITNGYERATGLRMKYQQADGFTIYASKTIAVPVEVLFDAFVNDGRRQEWLSDASMTLRNSVPGRVARFDWNGGPTRLAVTFDPKGPAKCTVAVAHERLPDADEAEKAKASWKQRLAHLKSVLESTG